jgi:hypothetical protein
MCDDMSISPSPIDYIVSYKRVGFTPVPSPRPPSPDPPSVCDTWSSSRCNYLSLTTPIPFFHIPRSTSRFIHYNQQTVHAFCVSVTGR